MEVLVELGDIAALAPCVFALAMNPGIGDDPLILDPLDEGFQVNRAVDEIVCCPNFVGLLDQVFGHGERVGDRFSLWIWGGEF